MTNDELNARCFEAMCDGIAEALDKCLPRTHGFALMVVETRPGGAVHYLSNLDDQGVIKLMRDFIARRAREDKERS